MISDTLVCVYPSRYEVIVARLRTSLQDQLMLAAPRIRDDHLSGSAIGANTIADLPASGHCSVMLIVMAAYSEYAQTEATASPGLQHVCALDLLQYWQPSAYPVAAHREPVEDAP
jgi:hypothetical protein